jgi:hypothetical protein
MDMMIVVLILAALDIAAMKWGFNSSDGIDSQEWVKRRAWNGFH